MGGADRMQKERAIVVCTCCMMREAQYFTVLNKFMEIVMKNFGLLVLAAAMCMMQGISFAADKVEAQQQNKAQVQQQDKVQKPATVYGSQLMTVEERAEYRAKMRSLKTPEERDALRMEHHQKMQERAKATGKTLPDMPAAHAGGACPAGGGSGGCCGAGGGCGAGACPSGGCGAGGCPGGCGAGGCCGGMQGGMHGAMHNRMHGTQDNTIPQAEAASGVHSH